MIWIQVPQVGCGPSLAGSRVPPCWPLRMGLGGQGHCRTSGKKQPWKGLCPQSPTAALGRPALPGRSPLTEKHIGNLAWSLSFLSQVERRDGNLRGLRGPGDSALAAFSMWCGVAIGQVLTWGPLDVHTLGAPLSDTIPPAVKKLWFAKVSGGGNRDTETHSKWRRTLQASLGDCKGAASLLWNVRVPDLLLSSFSYLCPCQGSSSSHGSSYS